MKKTFKIQNKSKGVAEMFLYGDISRWDISAKMVSEELKSLDEKINTVEVRLSSGGGDVFEGLSIMNRLKQIDKKIVVYIDGIAASIASIIMLAGDEVIIGEGAQVMIHKPFCWCVGNANELQNTIDRLDRVENEMIKIYKNKTGLSETEISKMIDDETWFNADEALEYGFVDKKVDENEQDFAMAACINPKEMIKDAKWIRKKELAKTNLEFQNKLNETINKFNDVLARK